MYVIADPAAAFREMHGVLRSGGSAAVTFPVRENFMRFNPAAKAEGFHFHELPDLEAAFLDAGFVDTRTERNDDVQFAAHCIPGHKRAELSYCDAGLVDTRTERNCGVLTSHASFGSRDIRRRLLGQRRDRTRVAIQGPAG